MNYSSHPQLQNPVFKLIGEQADKLGVKAYVIGGFVRDLILERPNKDIDIMSIGHGIELAIAVANELNIKSNLAIYKNFGTALLKFNDYEIEFVGARKESYRTNSRKPIVEDGSLEDDISRRDFTINAMAIQINRTNFGDLIDLYNGQSDIENKILRTPLDPNITFKDDPLRIFRGIRFASQINFTIEDKTLIAMAENASRIKILSKERIIDEVNKIILSSQPSKGFKLMFNTKILHEFFPEFVALHGVEVKNGRGHKDNFYHTLQVLENIIPYTNNLWLRWAALLHDIAKPPTKRFEAKQGWTFHGHEDLGARMIPKIFKNLALPQNEKMKYVQKLVQLHLRPIALTKENITDSAIRRLIFDAGDELDDLMTLCKADITSKNDSKVKRYLQNYEIVMLKIQEVEEKDHIRNFQPPITGEMIMEVFDVKPSKVIGIIKNTIKDAILDGVIENNYDQAYQLMICEAEKYGLVPKLNS